MKNGADSLKVCMETPGWVACRRQCRDESYGRENIIFSQNSNFVSLEVWLLTTPNFIHAVL